MVKQKSNKELAFLDDLFVSPDWGERFASLIDEHVTLPDEANALYLEAGSGGHALSLKQRGGEKFRLVAADENEESVALAKAKALAAKATLEFRHEPPDRLSLAADSFDLVIGNASLISINRLPAMMAELVRVGKQTGEVALVVPTFSSFGEFFSIYWEALHNLGLIEQEHDVEALITQLPTISEVEELAAQHGLIEIESFTQIEEFDYETGEAFLASPLIADFLMKGWLSSVPESERVQVAEEIARIINEERHDAEFALTVKATLVVGQKARSH